MSQVGWPGSNPNPVYVNWPGAGSIPRGGGIVDYNPKKLPFTGLYYMREGQKKIDNILDKAKKDYPKNVDQVKNDIDLILGDLKKSDFIKHHEIQTVVNVLQQAVDSLQDNIKLKNKLESEVDIKSKDTEKTFQDFMRKYKLKKFINKPYDQVDLAIATTGRWLHRLWDEIVTPKFSAEIEAKNKLITYLDRVKVITNDVIEKKHLLINTRNNVENNIREEQKVKNAIKFTADFYKELFEKYGEYSSKVAQELAVESKGKKIRGVNDALISFDKYKDVLNKKLSIEDRMAISRALESVNRANVAKDLAKFSKAFGYTGKVVNGYEIFAVELPKAIKSNNWRPFFVKVESIFAGTVASVITAYAFSIILGTPPGILGFALIMTLVCSFIDEELTEKMNNIIGV